MKKYILALDQGTTSSRAILFDQQQCAVYMAQREFAQHYPQPGWVEHDPEEIWRSQRSVMAEVLQHIPASELAAIGIANQRETTIVWERSTGQPIYPAIVWQCRRTAGICEQLAQVAGFAQRVRQTTGLLLDAYFSASKIKWLLDCVPGARERAESGELLFGTVDTWLLWRLSQGQRHATDYSNASRTMLFDIHKLCWDANICATLGIPQAMLPEVCDSSGVYCEVDLAAVLAGESRISLAQTARLKVPVAGIAGDQQAALFGQTCFASGMTKNTYGTGSFIVMQTGREAKSSQHGLLTTIAWGLDSKISYALEGSVFVAGAVLQWLRDELKIIDSAEDSEALAREVADSAGVYLVPAFVGLGAPHWDMRTRGAIVGLTRGAGRSHIVRAALESIAYQSQEVMQAMSRDSGVELTELRVDGGASRNNFLLQFQADISGQRVVRPAVAETTALGAALLAGLAVGFWRSQQELASSWCQEAHFIPQMSTDKRTELLAGWRKAVAAAQAAA